MAPDPQGPRRWAHDTWTGRARIETPPCLGVWGRDTVALRYSYPRGDARHIRSARWGRHRLPRAVGGKRRVRGPYPAAETPRPTHSCCRTSPWRGRSKGDGHTWDHESVDVNDSRLRRGNGASHGEARHDRSGNLAAGLAHRPRAAGDPVAEAAVTAEWRVHLGGQRRDRLRRSLTSCGRSPTSMPTADPRMEPLARGRRRLGKPLRQPLTRRARDGRDSTRLT